MTKTIYGSYTHFQEDSNTLKHVLFGYHMNKLWIFKISIITSPKMWVGSTKTVIQHDLRQLYICALEYVFSNAGLLFVGNEEVQNLGKQPYVLYGWQANVCGKSQELLICELVSDVHRIPFQLVLWLKMNIHSQPTVSNISSFWQKSMLLYDVF
jgi:hypothetical protein